MSIYTTNNRLRQIMETTKGSTLGMGGITLLIVVMMIFFAVLPAYRSITDQLKNNETKNTYLDKLKQKKSVLDKLSVSYQNNLEKINYFNLYNNPVPNTETFAANMDAIAKANHTLLTSITISGGDTYQATDTSPFLGFNTIKPQRLTLEFNTKVENITPLIRSLENFPLTIFIYTLNVSQKQNIELYADKGPLSQNDMMVVTVIGEIYFWNISK